MLLVMGEIVELVCALNLGHMLYSNIPAWNIKPKSLICPFSNKKYPIFSL